MKLNGLEALIMQDGRSKKDIAAACGFPNTRLSEYVKGKKEIPVSHMIVLAEVLRCDPEAMIGEVELIDTEMAW